MQEECSPVDFCLGIFLNGFAGVRSPAIGGWRDPVIRQFIWPVLLALLPSPGVNEGTDLRGIYSLGCWSW